MSNPEFLRLQRIIKSSNRVKNLRRSFGLKQNEYIITFVDDKSKVSDGVKTDLKKLTNHNSDLRYYATDFCDAVKKEVVDHFDLNMKAMDVADAILKSATYISPFLFQIQQRINKRGNAEVTIELYELPPADALDALLQEIKEQIRFYREFHRTKNTKGLSTAPPPYGKMDTVQRFDEKFEIVRDYRALQKQYSPKRIPRPALQAFCSYAAGLLGIKTTFNGKDLQKMIANFEKSYGQIG